jgi:hypothetical protein
VGDDLLHHREHPGRSVNDIEDLRQRAAWFDSTKTGPTLPYWRLSWEYFLAIWRGNLPVAEKMRCCIPLAKWIKWGAWRNLVQDLVYYVKN